MQIKFIDLSRVDYEQYEDAIKRIFKHGIFILGKEVEEFEEEISKIFGSYCIGVSSGTDALVLSLMAYDIKAGDEVILPNISYIASANAIRAVGATPVFCDVDDDFNIDVKKIKKLITNKTKAIMIVHYAGTIGKIEEAIKIVNEHNLILIEDSSQAFGAKKNGRLAGTFGDIGAFSLNPMKVLGAFGEAGMVLTPRKDIYEKIKALRNNGLDSNKIFRYAGLNAKMDALQAALLKEKLKTYKKSIQKRQDIVKKYNEAFKEFLIIPRFDENFVYFTYTILSDRRDELLSYLLKNGIEAKVYHTAITQELPYKKYNHKDLNNSLRLSKQKLALPCNEYMKEDEIEYMINKVIKFIKVNNV